MGLVDSIIGAESGGDPNAQNPNSSASGPGQFIDSTWLSTIRQARPDLAGQSDADLLALKTDPQIARQMTEAYANQNQAFLAKNGLPVTPGTTYLAHFAGPQGAAKVLQADPNAAVGDILGPAVVKANPFLANMSAKDLQAWAERKMGGNVPQPQQTAQVSQPSGINAIPQAPAPIMPQQAQPSPSPAPNFGSGGSVPQFAQIPQTPLQPIFYAPRKPIDLSALRAALSRNA